MRIFLTNDDGASSEGLKVLWRHLQKLGEVFVFVPDTEKSGSSHSITFFNPIEVRRTKIDGEIDAYLVNGTPADCVKIGVKSILKQKPDILISGINPGANTGMYIRYSGTVSAAAEGIILGIPSVAVSVETSKVFHFDEAAEITLKILKEMDAIGFPDNTILNINIPSCELNMIKGIKTTHQDDSKLDTVYEERQNPSGNSYFWMRSNHRTTDGEKGSDVDALKDKFVSITPLHLNLTNHNCLSLLKKDNKFENIRIK